MRAAIRRGEWTGPTAGLAPAYVQGLRARLARARAARAGAALRTDLPGYRMWRDGEPAEERPDIRELWRDDLVAFLIGCLFISDQSDGANR